MRSKIILLWFIPVLVISTLSILFWDRPVALYMKHEQPESWYRFFKIVTDLGEGGPWFALFILAGLCFYFLGKKTQDTQKQENYIHRGYCFFFGFSAMAISGISIVILKIIIGRYRPKYLIYDEKYGFSPFNFDMGMNSLPSGHSQTIWSAIIAIILMFRTSKFITTALILLAIIVSGSRVMVTAHYISDVLLGSYLGIAITLLLYQWFTWRWKAPALKLS